MDKIFDLCVDIIQQLSGITGMSYKHLNVLLFVVIQPFITLMLFVMFFYIWYKYIKMKYNFDVIILDYLNNQQKNPRNETKDHGSTPAG